MSRSRKKHPVFTWVGGGSEKFSKKTSSGKFRARVRRLLAKDSENDMPTKSKEVMNPYEFRNDGTKHYFTTRNGRMRLEDPETKEFIKKIMRK